MVMWWCDGNDGTDVNFIGSLVDDFDDMTKLEEGNSNNILQYTFLHNSTMNEVSDNNLSTEL